VSIVTFLDSLLGNANHLDLVLIAGGGANEPLMTDTLERKYPHALIVNNRQNAIALGCARRARRMVAEMAMERTA
jgi:hypothetical protein